MSLRRVLYLVKKELIQFWRDKKLVRLTLVSPIMQLIIFGYAITSDVRNISVAVLDMDHTQESRALVDRFTASRRYFDIEYTLTSPDQIDRLLDAGKVQMALWIPRGFSRNLARGRKAQVQVIIDGTDSRTASTISGYVNAIAASYSRNIAVRAMEARGGTLRLPSVDPRIRAWYNPELKSVNYLVPGVLAMIVFIITMILTSLAVVREREIGTLEQLIVTPIKPIELMIGKIAPFAIVGYVNIIMIVAVAVFWFRVPMQGSFLLLLVLSAAFLMSSLGFGLLISTISRTQQQAMMVSFFIMQPSILLSGFMFPIENMPGPIQLVTYLIPLRYFLEIVRGIFLRGVGMSVLWPQVLALLVIGTGVVVMSAVRFTKRVG